jgi:hypothetical protein
LDFPADVEKAAPFSLPDEPDQDSAFHLALAARWIAANIAKLPELLKKTA